MRDQPVNTLRPKHFQLITLGRIALRSLSGEDGDLGRRRRKLALLAVIALSRRPPSRSSLAEMFWGAEDENRARHSLSDALSHLRRALGKEAIAIRSDVVELQMEGRLAVDAIEFEAACESGDLGRAIALYGGPFLGDFHVEDSASFDDWVTRARDRFARLFVQACEAHVTALLRASAFTDAHAVALRWLEADAVSSSAISALLRAALGGDNREMSRAALDEQVRWTTRRARDLDATADSRVDTLASELAERERGRVDDVDTEPPSSVETHQALTPDAQIAVPHRVEIRPARSHRSRSIGLAAFAAALIAAVSFALASGRRATAGEVQLKPVIALVDFRTDAADSSLAWLQEGLKQMISADLARVSTADVIPPSVMRSAAERAGWTAAPTPAQSVDLANAVHATLAVSASISRSEGSYVVNATLRPVNSTRAAERYTATGTDVSAVADEIAAHVLSVAGIGTGGPHFSDVETSNTEAFRLFIDGQRDVQEGREADANEKFDAAIAADSGFTSAIVARLHSGDPAVYARVKPLFDRARARLTEWDRLSEAVYEAFHNGEHARAEVLANELVARFPYDPRAIERLADIYANHGRFRDAENAYLRLLALDSLAMMAGTGSCSACSAYYGLAGVRHAERDYAGQVRAAKRLTELQPGAPGAWQAYAAALNIVGATDDAIVAARHARDLHRSAGFDVFTARALVMARRYDEAEALALHSLGGPGDAEARDILLTLHRERGEFRTAIALFAPAIKRGEGGALELVVAHSLGSLGDASEARRMFERTQSDPKRLSAAAQSVGAGRADDARNFAWGHALEADAIWELADTAFLRALADSVETIGARSYYARDWQLHHHVRGLVAIRGGHLDVAERELSDALARYPGWTRTNLMLARVRIARGQPERAIETLRWAYYEPLDAMGRYATRTELDVEMSRAFRALGRGDSAAVYRAHVNRAWNNADPEIKQRLTRLN